MPSLLVSVRFHDGRYHGWPEWPPSPARLLQALVAGAAQGETLVEEDWRAFAWLEALEPPVIAAPPMRAGQRFRNYVPNNDLDAVGGDPGRVGEIRTPKLFRPLLFNADTPLLYAWMFEETLESRANVERICAIAERLYQLGRGVDMAWARGEVLGQTEVEARLAAPGGAVYRASDAADGTMLAVPLRGSIISLVERHRKMRTRIQTLHEHKPSKKEPARKVSTGQMFVQPPKPRFRQVAYASPAVRLVLDLAGEQVPWRFERIVELTECVRDAAARRLADKRPDAAERIRRTIIGHRDADAADKAGRIRIVPLPSIGHRHADRGIRRILVEIPPNCPVRLDDLEWVFSGLEVIEAAIDPETGEVLDQLLLTPAPDRGMLKHYGIGDVPPARVWRTVTPAALPQQASRRRIDPARQREDAKGSSERVGEEGRAVSAVPQALRHADVSQCSIAVRVQREPFDANGRRAEAFAPGTRFAKERLWHTEIEFASAIHGPLILGDGRYLGLGLMRPVWEARRDVIVFALQTDMRILTADRPDLLRAVRRALMALSRDVKGNASALFSGHEPRGGPARSGRHRHVFLGCADLDRDGQIDQIMVAAPWICDRTVRPKREAVAEFEQVVSLLATVRAGRLGVVGLRPVETARKLIGPAHIWESHTEYRPTRHAGRHKDPDGPLLQDIAAECERRGFPRPGIELLGVTPGPNEGVSAMLRLRFSVAIAGPLLLGRDSHHGGGLFLANGEVHGARA